MSSYEDQWWSYRLEPAGFFRRAVAALIDVTLALVALGAYYWFFRGFNDVVQQHLNPVLQAAMDPEVLERTLGKILGLAAILHLVYGTVMEHSPWSGTLGKWLTGIRVVDEYGERLSLTASAVRNLVKFVSLAALGIGFLAALWRPGRQAWHDRAAGSFVARG